MENIPDLLTFARVADTLSFAEAARRGRLSPSAVGKAVARLEAEFGTRLFQRSTRRVSLTAEGGLLLDRVRRIIAELEDIDATMTQTAALPRGRLRLSLPTIGYRFLGPLLPDFLARFPAITLDIDYDDRLIDVIASGVDAAIRSGEQPDSQLMTRKLGDFVLGLYAAPAYLERSGTPAEPADLLHHRRLCFRFAITGAIQEWRIPPPMLAQNLPPPTLVCNNIEALRDAAIAGLGLAWMPHFLVADAIDEKRLMPVLADQVCERGSFWLVWPSSRHLSPKLRAFADHLAKHLLF